MMNHKFYFARIANEYLFKKNIRISDLEEYLYAPH